MNAAQTSFRADSRWRLGIAIAARVLAAVGAGYACAAAGVALLATALPLAFGIARGDAVVLAAMCGFPLYLAILVWGFSQVSLIRLWTILPGVAVLCWMLARWLPAPATGAG